ncbi:MAG: hypothetical protein QOF48_3936, partial [Verrucomicrobiota bacterium]
MECDACTTTDGEFSTYRGSKWEQMSR